MKKVQKVLIFSFIFIVFLSLNAYCEEYVKIGLKYNTKAVSSCKVSAYDNGAVIVNVGAENLINATDNAVNLLYDNGSITVMDKNNVAPHFVMTDTSSFIEIGSTNNIVELDGKAYRGTLIFTSTPNGIQVVNYVGIEDYLKSVVPSEMPSSWNIEALKTQAVCARNYTVVNKGKLSKYGFDLDDTTACQAYAGISSENPRTTQAVEETKGIIALYEDKPANLFYYSSSGGYTEDVKNVWGSTNYPYLVSVPDPYDPLSKWEVKFTSSELKDKLFSVGIDVGDIKGVEVTKRTDAGRAVEVIITGSTGSYTAKLEKTRNVFGLKSSMYTISSSGEAVLTPKSVITEYGVEKRYISRPVMTAKGIVPLETTQGSPDEFVFTGYGWGHGIGMSQYGSKGFADNGYTYDKIILHYFPGTTLGTY